MKKLLVPIVLVLAAMCAQAASAATVASARGAGQIHFGNSHEFVSFDASLQDDGTATGSAVFHSVSAGVRGHIDVNCLNVIGNFAIVSGVITSSNDPGIVGDEAAFAVQDNGEGHGAPPDLMSLVNIYEVGVGPDCHVLAEYDLVPLDSGNIQVSSA
jgi:opacity protein-like surface antigen